MTDLKDRLAQLLHDEPTAPYDIDRIVTTGRRSRRRQHAALAAAGTIGAAGLTAAVVIPVVGSGGNEAAVKVADQPSAKPTQTHHQCEFFVASGSAHRAMAQVRASGKFADPGWSFRMLKSAHGKTAIEACRGQDFEALPTEGAAPPAPAGPPYHYSEKPGAIADRLGTHLHDRVTSFGLAITYVRTFSQESTKPDAGHPSYFDGNVDVHEASGYADIGVQVTHEVTEQVPFDGDCTAAEHCEETTLPDGSVLRTGQVSAGRGLTVLTAEVHRPDGVIVAAQESNYPFGPDAGSQEHGDQPLSLDQLTSLAKDADFTF